MTWSPTEIAQQAAAELEHHDVVIVGAGLPEMIRNQLAEKAVVVLDENGIVGAGPDRRGRGRGTQPNAKGERVAVIAGGSLQGPLEAAALLRRGWVDVGVLEVGSVSANGQAQPPGPSAGQAHAPGLLPEIAFGAGRLIALAHHAQPGGQPALLGPLPESAKGFNFRPIKLLITQLGVFRPAGNAFEILALAPGVSVSEASSQSAADLIDARRSKRDLIPEQSNGDNAKSDRELDADEGELLGSAESAAGQ